MYPYLQCALNYSTYTSWKLKYAVNSEHTQYKYWTVKHMISSVLIQYTYLNLKGSNKKKKLKPHLLVRDLKRIAICGKVLGDDGE